MNMKQYQLSDEDAADYMRATGAMATARYQLAETIRRILGVHGVDPKTPHQIDGNALTVMEATDNEE